MEKKMFKHIMLLITYTVVLVAVIVKLDTVGGWLSMVLSAFKPLFFGFAIAFILNRPCNFFFRVYNKILPKRVKKIARALAVITVYVIVLLLAGLLIALVVPELVHSIQTFTGNLSTYGANLQELYDTVVQKLDLEFLGELDLMSLVSNNLGDLFSGVLDGLTNTLPHLVTVTSAVVSAIVTGLLSLVFSIYMLGGADKLKGQCRRLVDTYVPQRFADPLLRVTKLTADTFTKYITGQLVEAFILGILCFIGMCIFRFDYAPLISVIIGVSALIPVAGAYIGAILAVLLLVMIDPLEALLFLVFLVVLQQLEDNLVYPRVVGTSLGLPGIWVLAAVTVGGSLMGFAGLIAGVPIAAVLYVLLKKDLNRRLPQPEVQESGTEESETKESE